MVTDLMKSLEKPAKFQQSETMFWTDPHIATYLLEAHLDQTHEGASRKVTFIKESVTFISQDLMKKGSQKMIDYGCGPGLYSERFAELGYQVTGVDFSGNSIQYAKVQANKKGLAIDYRVENYLNRSEEELYDFATLIYCDYGALAPEARIQFLRNSWTSLKKGGSLLLDVFTEHKYNQFVEQQTWQSHENGGFWSPQPYVELGQQIKYEQLVSLEQSVILTNETTETYFIWNQYFTREMLTRELEAAGFTVLSVYNDVSGSDYSEGNDTMAILVEK